MIETIRTWAAQALVFLAAAVLPKDKADKLKEVARPIWRPNANKAL